MNDANLYRRFEAAFAAAGTRTALRSPTGDARMSYRDLGEAVGRTANALAALGVAPGDRVGVQAEKSMACVLVYLATLKAGAVHQPLNTAYTAAELGHFIADAEPRVIVCDPARQAEMRALGDRHGVRAVVNLDAAGRGSFSELASRMDTTHETVSRAATDLAGLLYTSGTTGRAKGAMITHGNLASNAETLVALWRMGPSDVLLHALPVFHVHGLHVALNTAFLAGCEIVWLAKFDAGAVVAALPEATVMMGVPTFYTRLLAAPAFGRDSCRSMRLFVSGSAPLLAETHAAFARRTGHAIVERYGMTETGMIASNPYDGPRVAGTVGFPLPGIAVRLGGGEPGVIEVKGPNVFSGYWRMAEKTAEDFTPDGYFITGDLGTFDAEGRLTIVGRARDLIISGGLNVYPGEVEEALGALPGIAESAVVGVPHPDFGEAVVAAVTASGDPGPESELIAALAERLARFKLPKRIFVVPELPRNAMGKVQKAQLRERFGDAFAPPAGVRE
jgi:malonyl-CoA/methylmalonyl-CoA synthetase